MAIYGYTDRGRIKFLSENFIEECEHIEYQFGNRDWCVADGVRTSTLNRILKKHNVSYYSYDITNECFDKYVATNRNFKTLVYYSVNNHMYWVGDEDKALSLIRSASAVETNIRTDMIDDYEQKNIYLDDNGQVKPIFENIPIQDLMQEQYNNSIISYTTDVVKDGDTFVIDNKDDLNTELIEIIRHHQYIPSGIKHDRYIITRIIFQKDGRSIILTLDCNRKSIRDIDYKDVLKICKTHDIEFKNQSFGSLV